VKSQAQDLECKEIKLEEAIDHLQGLLTQAVIALVKLRIIRDKIQKMGF
jgi:hypothetical protein